MYRIPIPTTYDPSNDFRQRRIYVFGGKKLKKKITSENLFYHFYFLDILFSPKSFQLRVSCSDTHTHTYIHCTRYRVYGKRNRRGVAVLRAHVYVQYMIIYICMCIVDGHKVSIYVKRARGLHIFIIRRYYVAL